MLAPQHHPFPRHYQIYQNKLITIISPYTGEQFKIELSGEESEFRELLATLLNIDPSYIKGLKDSYGNYYTISCALKDPYIFANGNDLFSLVLNLQNNNYNKYKHLSNPYNKNLLYNINNNYHNRTEYNEIYIGNRKNKLLEDNYNSSKNKKQIRKYSTLIKKLIPAINRNFKEEDNYNYEPNTSYFDEYSLSKRDKYQKILEKQKSNFNKEQMNILRELLKMENITIINYFKIYEKSKNKKDLIKNLNILSKKYQKKLKKVSETEEESEESISDNDEKDKKGKKNKKYNKNKSSTESEESSSSHPASKNQKKGHHHKKNSSSKNESDNDSDNDNESITSNKSNEENENNEEEEENEEESEDKKHNFPIKCTSLSELINAIKDELDDKIDLSCLFANEIDFIKKTETQKMQLIKEEFDIQDFTLTENSFELIKKHYENILKKVIMKDLSKEEKDLLLKLIKKKNKSIKLRFKALLRHNNYEFLLTDIKECLNDRLKKNQKKIKKHKNKNESDGDEHQINLEERESMSINSNSNNDNENEGEEEFMGESTKSIRKNERMAKNNKKNKNGNGSQKSKSKDDESAGQFKLFQMEDSSEDNSESNKKDNKKDNIGKQKENISKKNGDGIKDEEFINVINKLKNEGKLDITEKEVKILENEFKNKSEKLRSIWEIYQIELEEEDFIDSLKLILKLVNKNGDYIINDDNENNEKNDNNQNKDDNNDEDNSNNDGEKDKPYAKEIISGLKGAKFSKKGNKKIINILLKNKIFTKEEMRNIEEDLDQNNQFVVGTFELLYVIMNVEDFVENLNIRLHMPEGENGQNQNSAVAIDDEKYNQIRNNLENIVKSFSEEDQNKIRELFEKKDINLLNILESEVNDIEKAKASILNFLGKN